MNQPGTSPAARDVSPLRICATVAAKDLDQSRKFYETVLKLVPALVDTRRGVYYRAADGTMLNLYERDAAVPEVSVATFLVSDLAAVMTDLRRRGANFIDYDLPDLTTDNGVYRDETGFAVAWLHDPSGNVIGFEQLPDDV